MVCGQSGRLNNDFFSVFKGSKYFFYVRHLAWSLSVQVWSILMLNYTGYFSIVVQDSKWEHQWCKTHIFSSYLVLAEKYFQNKSCTDFWMHNFNICCLDVLVGLGTYHHCFRLKWNKENRIMMSKKGKKKIDFWFLNLYAISYFTDPYTDSTASFGTKRLCFWRACMSSFCLQSQNDATMHHATNYTDFMHGRCLNKNMYCMW